MTKWQRAIAGVAILVAGLSLQAASERFSAMRNRATNSSAFSLAKPRFASGSTPLNDSLNAPAFDPKSKIQNLKSDWAVPVLMYHRISDLTPEEARSPLMRDLTVSPQKFEAQVKFLVDNGFTFLLAREVETALREHKPLPEKAIVLTMDDGYKDNFDCAFPILRKYNVPATLFLVTNTVNTNGHVSWDDVLLMKHERVGYGSHTVHHYDLPSLSPAQLDYELRESKRVLEEKLVEQISAVAYPSGQYNAKVAEQARLVGYDAGWKKGGGPVQPGADPYLLPRVRVNGGTTQKDFERKIWSGVYTQQMRRETRMWAARPTTHRHRKTI